MIQFSEKFEPEKVLSLLSRGLPYYLKSCTLSGLFGSIDPKQFNMQNIESSSPVIEYVIRPHINILCIYATFIKHGKIPTELEKDVTINQLISLVKKGIMWICNTHITGESKVETFLHRKQWGENWRSGTWASLLAISMFLTKEHLDTKYTDAVKKVLAFEANRFIDTIPPSGCTIDTKLEENAQDSMVLAWAINLLPDHPHCKKWEKALTLWALNIATSIADKADHSEYKGRSISSYTVTETLFPDMTAENYGFFNTEILTYGVWVVLAMAAYRLTNKEVPSIFLRRNHQEIFDILLSFCLPTGMLYTPASSDLPLFTPHPLALSWGLWNNDPRAQRMTTSVLSWMDTMLPATNSNEVPWIPGFKATHEGWELYFQSQVGFELAMLSVLPFPKEHRYYTMGQIENAVDTKKIYPYIEVCYRRNTRSTRSVAWKALDKHPVIGMSIHSHPGLLVPFNANMLGIPSLNPTIRSWKVAFHEDFNRKFGFDTYGRIEYFDEKNKLICHRDIRVITWGQDGFVVLDLIIADCDCLCNEHYLSPIYLVNDHWTENSLDLVSGSLHETINNNKKQSRPLTCPAFWASIDNVLLFQFLWGENRELTYIPGCRHNAPKYWKNCRLDMMAIYTPQKDIKKGSIIYQTGFFIGAGKGPRPFKSSGIGNEFFKGIVIMDGKNTVGLT